jgi:murein DD-endopeptidase MepM/ murein hydrolase activator NlpD
VGCVMSEIVGFFRAGFALRLVLVGAAAGLLAGCSSSERLSDPLSNPFQNSARLEGQAPAGGVAASVPVSPVQSRPLSAPAAGADASAQQSPQVSSLLPPREMGSSAGWSAQGGSPIVVAQGENAQILANRYGVPVDALVRTNGLSTASQIQPGTRLIIPVYNAALAASSGVRGAPKATAIKVAAKAKVLGEPPRTLAERAAQLKTANARAAKTASVARSARVNQKEAQSAIQNGRGQKTLAAAGETTASPNPANQAAVPPGKSQTGQGRNQTAGAAGAPVSEAANPEFRWPARGRIIQAFKAGGNDGINIALPEGTSVKAAESGVVAYAGNELKGYGNLILIRHPNGFVSAYANTSEIEVKRGDTVKRGQTIAKSGQSGNVSTPQLHFELRKGTTPVDPTQYLAGA